MRISSTVLLVTIVGFGLAASAGAQPVGTFSWQQQPYCNVVTMNVVQSGGVFLLDGVDDQCGSATRGAVVGIAFPNPNGTIGLGLTLVTTPGGTPLHLDATVSLPSASGTWRDSTGGAGNWVLATGSASGSPRPVPRLSAGGQVLSNVGSPVSPGDAVPKSYADAGVAAVASYAKSLATLEVPISADAGTSFAGNFSPTGYGCRNAVFGQLSLFVQDLTLPIGATLQAVKVRYLDSAAQDLSFGVQRHEMPAAAAPSTTSLPLVYSSGSSTFMRSLTIPLSVPPVTDARSYSIVIGAPSHVTGDMFYCGSTVIYSLP